MQHTYDEKPILDFFQKLGYEVSFDWSIKDREIWWEVTKDDELVCQIEKGVPLEIILQDLLCYADGKSEGDSNYPDYKICLDDGDLSREFLRKVKEHAPQN